MPPLPLLRSLLIFLSPIITSAATLDPQSVVQQYVQQHGHETFREPAGILRFPYIVPAGPYNQLWDWDSMFTGIALLPYGSAPYLQGSMLNFLDHTNSSGMVRGCLTPDGATETEYHAKPIIIQGSYLAASNTGNFSVFQSYLPQMEALIDYWFRDRYQPDTGLFVWYDQLESGCDNLVISTCPSHYSACWNASVHSMVMAAPDIMTFLFRETTSLALFLEAWAADGVTASVAAEYAVKRAHYLDRARMIRMGLDSLWNETLGCYVAYNTSAAAAVTNRVFLMAHPLWAGLASAEQAARAVASLLQADMWTPFGVRSVSSLDPRYTNENVIKPYSNWRGPVWVNANAMLAYGLAQYNITKKAMELASNVVGTLANDIITSSTWHECYNSDTGAGLAAPGFLSWNTLGAALVGDIASGRNPFALMPRGSRQKA